MSAPDFTSLGAAVDFSNVVAAVVAIGAALMAPMVVVWGTQKVLAMVQAGEDDRDAYDDYLAREREFEDEGEGGGQAELQLEGGMTQEEAYGSEGRNALGQTYDEWEAEGGGGF